jgi:AraC-like DNA-binding protein
MNFESYIPIAVEQWRSQPSKATQLVPAAGNLVLLWEDEAFAKDEQIHVAIHNPDWAGACLPYRHSHDFFEMTWVYRGYFMQHLEGHEVTQSTDEVIILRPGSVHGTWTNHPSDIAFNIMLRKRSVESVLLRLMSPQNPLYSFCLPAAKDNRPNYLVFSGARMLAQSMQQLVMEYFDQSPDSQQMLATQLLTVFTQLARLTYREAPRSASFVTADILSYIQHNYLDIRQQDLATHFGYSTRQLARILKSATGKTFPQLINELKIAEICHHLELADTNPIDLALSMGFSDPSYFYKVFRQVKGITFTEFRNSRRLGPSASPAAE